MITTDTGEEQQLKFVSYRNALRELSNDIQDSDEEEGQGAEESSSSFKGRGVKEEDRTVQLAL